MHAQVKSKNKPRELPVTHQPQQNSQKTSKSVTGSSLTTTSLRQQWKGWQVRRCSCVIPALKWSILFLLFQFTICFSHPHSPAQWDLTPLCSRLSSGKLNGWKEEGMMKCRNFHFVQNRPKPNADRAHHTAQCPTGSWLVWRVFLVKPRARLLQPSGCHIPPFASWRGSSITDPTQACDTSYSCQKIQSRTIYLFLHTCLTVPSDTRSLGCVFQTWLPKPVWPAPASSNCQVQFLSLRWAPLKCRGANKTPNRRKPP